MRLFALVIVLSHIACSETSQNKKASMVSEVLHCSERLDPGEIIFSFNDDQQSFELLTPNEKFIIQNQVLRNLIDMRTKLLRSFAQKKLKISESVTKQEVETYLSKNASLFPSSLSKEQIFKISETHLTQQKLDQSINAWISKEKDKIEWTSHFLSCPPPLNILDRSKLLLKSGSSATSGELLILSSPACTACRTLWPKIMSFLQTSEYPISFAPLPDLSEEGFNRFTELLTCLEKGKSTNTNLEIVDRLHRNNLKTLENEEIFNEFSNELADSTKTCLNSNTLNEFDALRTINTSNQPHLFIDNTLVGIGYESIIDALNLIKYKDSI